PPRPPTTVPAHPRPGGRSPPAEAAPSPGSSGTARPVGPSAAARSTCAGSRACDGRSRLAENHSTRRQPRLRGRLDPAPEPTYYTNDCRNRTHSNPQRRGPGVHQRRRHGFGTEILRRLKLRAKGRQSDEQIVGHLQAASPGTEADPGERRLLRAKHQRGPGLLQAQNRSVSRRGCDGRSRRRPPEEKVTLPIVTRLLSRPPRRGRRKDTFMLFFGRKKRLIDYASCAG